jgi:Tetracyclin repressor-like, C-terminal domain
VYDDDLKYLGPERLTKSRRRRRAMEQLIIGLLEEAQQGGDIHPSVDTELASHAMFATLNWLYRWYKPRRRVSPAAIADFYVEFILRGITGAQPAVSAKSSRSALPALHGGTVRPSSLSSLSLSRNFWILVADIGQSLTIRTWRGTLKPAMAALQ